MPVRTKLLERYPALATLPDDCDLDTPLPLPETFEVTVDWNKAGNLIPIGGQKRENLSSPPKPNHAPIDADVEEAEMDDVYQGRFDMVADSTLIEETPLTWSDVALSIGAEIVLECRSAVHERLGYTCSAGIAPNKVRFCPY